MIRVRNMCSPRTGNEVANQFIITVGSKTYFQSYNTIIAVVECGRITLDKDFWNYSRTTSKYRNEFTGYTTEETKKLIKDGRIGLKNLNN